MECELFKVCVSVGMCLHNDYNKAQGGLHQLEKPKLCTSTNLYLPGQLDSCHITNY